MEPHLSTLHTLVDEALEELAERIDNAEKACEKQHNVDEEEQDFGKVARYDMRERACVGETLSY